MTSALLGEVSRSPRVFSIRVFLLYDKVPHPLSKYQINKVLLRPTRIECHLRIKLLKFGFEARESRTAFWNLQTFAPCHLRQHLGPQKHPGNPWIPLTTTNNRPHP